MLSPTDDPVSRAEEGLFFELVLRLILAGVSIVRRPERAGAVAGLSPHMMRTIMFLQDHDDLTVGDLAEALGISLGRASRIADQFERLGVVTRVRDPQDRRVVRLRKTPEARAITERRTVRARAVVGLIADFPPEQRAAIADFLRRVAEEFERLRAEEEGLDPTGELQLERSTL